MYVVAPGCRRFECPCTKARHFDLETRGRSSPHPTENLDSERNPTSMYRNRFEDICLLEEVKHTALRIHQVAGLGRIGGFVSRKMTENERSW